jgi:hypothetical protein
MRRKRQNQIANDAADESEMPAPQRETPLQKKQRGEDSRQHWGADIIKQRNEFHFGNAS